MNYLNKKFWRDIKALWPQFISVLIMAMISVTIYSGMSCVWTGMKSSYENYESNSNLADGFIMAESLGIEQLDNIAKLEYIKQAQPSMTTKVNVSTTQEESDLLINTFTESTLEVMNPVIRSGETLKNNAKGIWIDEDYANAHSLHVGDSIDFYIGDTSHKTEILGTVLQAENIFYISSPTESVPDHLHHGYAYISEKYAKQLYGNVIYNQVRIKLDESVNLSKEHFQKDLSERVGDSFYSATLKEDKISVTRVQEEQEQIKKMAILFSMVFILLSILSMYTTMNRLVNHQIVQIGTMKSLGFFNKQIYVHYGLYGLLVSSIGSLIGIGLGYFVVTELVMNIKKSTLTLPEWKKVIGVDCLIMIVLIVLICTISAVFTAKKVVKTVPALTIRGMIEKKNRNTKELKRSKLSHEWILTIRGIKVHPIKYLMGVIAIAGSIVLMVAGVGVWDSLSSSYNQVFAKQYHYEYVGNIQGLTSDQAKEVFKKCEVQLGKVDSAQFVFGDMQKDGVVSFLEEGSQICFYEYETGKQIKLQDEEAVISYKLAKSLKIKCGDVLCYTLNNTSEQQQIRITEIVDAKLPQGIFMDANKCIDFAPNTIYISGEEGYSFAKEQSYISGLISIEKQRENMNEMMESVQSIMYILILAAFLLSAIILYNLGILSFVERCREYATMKVLGFYEKEMVGLVFKECCLNLIPGLLIGIPLSRQFLKLYVSIVSMENMEWTPYITDLHFVIIIGIVIMFSMLISLFVCGRIKKVNMVEAMKTIE